MDAEPLTTLATTVGQAWATELVSTFGADDRVLGPWPGTLREARMRILSKVRRKLALETLDDLARVATIAARQEWDGVSQPDPEP